MYKIVAGTSIRESRMELNGFWESGWVQAGILLFAVLAAVVVAMLVEL
jgi:hypothetical protein